MYGTLTISASYWSLIVNDALISFQALAASSATVIVVLSISTLFTLRASFEYENSLSTSVPLLSAIITLAFAFSTTVFLRVASISGTGANVGSAVVAP